MESKFLKFVRTYTQSAFSIQIYLLILLMLMYIIIIVFTKNTAMKVVSTLMFLLGGTIVAIPKFKQKSE